MRYFSSLEILFMSRNMLLKNVKNILRLWNCISCRCRLMTNSRNFLLLHVLRLDKERWIFFYAKMKENLDKFQWKIKLIIHSCTFLLLFVRATREASEDFVNHNVRFWYMKSTQISFPSPRRRKKKNKKYADGN